ncbi:GNAT family N-acetyltransferase [Chitinimonas lacunae]|uniref:GNAT family N-acetyltransferase n=1 Tax=Chitinimonas lacunae TaxID=1963018 RepID=A0ABV8MRZ9_9NEIS
MDDKPSLREGKPADALCLGVLAMQVFLDTYATEGIRPDLAREALQHYGPAAFAARLADPSLCFILAERHGHLLGFAEVQATAAAATAQSMAGVELIRLYIQRHAQRQGLGQALLRAAEQLARVRKSPNLWLTAWVGNRNACDFYTAQGYREAGMTEYVFEGQAYLNRIYMKELG